MKEIRERKDGTLVLVEEVEVPFANNYTPKPATVDLHATLKTLAVRIEEYRRCATEAISAGAYHSFADHIAYEGGEFYDSHYAAMKTLKAKLEHSIKEGHAWDEYVLSHNFTILELKELLRVHIMRSKGWGQTCEVLLDIIDDAITKDALDAIFASRPQQ